MPRARSAAPAWCVRITRRLPLYGGGASDIVVCVAAMSMATTASLLRVTSDRHYISDVIVGTGLGLGLGFALPFFFHYREQDEPNAGRAERGWKLSRPSASTPWRSTYPAGSKAKTSA